MGTPRTNDDQKEYDCVMAQMLEERISTWRRARQSQCFQWFDEAPIAMVICTQETYDDELVAAAVLEEAARQGAYLDKNKPNETDFFHFARTFARLFGKVGRKQAVDCLQCFNKWAGTDLDLDTAALDVSDNFTIAPPVFQPTPSGGEKWRTWVVELREKPDESAWAKAALLQSKKIDVAGLLCRRGRCHMVFRACHGEQMSSAKSFLGKGPLEHFDFDMKSVHHLDHFDVDLFGAAVPADLWTLAGATLETYDVPKKRREDWMAWRCTLAGMEPNLETLPCYAKEYCKAIHLTGTDSQRIKAVVEAFAKFAQRTDPNFNVPEKLNPALEKAFFAAMNVGDRCQCNLGATRPELGRRRLHDGAAVDFCTELCRMRFDRQHPNGLMAGCGSTQFEPFWVFDPLSLRPGCGPPRKLHGRRCAACLVSFFFSRGREPGRLLGRASAEAQL